MNATAQEFSIDPKELWQRLQDLRQHNRGAMKLDKTRTKLFESLNKRFQALQSIREEYCRDLEYEHKGYLNAIKNGRTRRSGQEGEKPGFYADFEDHQRLVRESWDQIKRDPAISGSNLEKAVNFAVGSCLSFRLCKRERFEALFESNPLAQKYQEIEQALELATDEDSGFRQVVEETFRRFFRDGDVIQMDSDNSKYGMRFIESCYLCPPHIESTDIDDGVVNLELNIGGKKYSEFDLWMWKFGIVALAEDCDTPLAYWIKGPCGDIDEMNAGENQNLIPTNGDWDHALVSAENIEHLKQGVDINDPRGVPKNRGLYCDVLKKKEIECAAAQVFLLQAMFAVVFDYSDDVSANEVVNAAKGLDSALKKEQKKTGKTPRPGTHHAKGYEIKATRLGLDINQALELVNNYNRNSGAPYCYPEFVSTGNGGSGNKSNFEQLLKPMVDYFTSTRATVGPNIVGILWKIVGTEIGLKPSEIEECRRYLKIITEWAPISFEPFSDWVQTMLDLKTEDIVSPELIQRQLKIDPRKIAEDLAKLRSDQPEPVDLPDSE